MKLDPLMAANDTAKPLLSKLLAAPALRERYLAHCRWGPLAQKLHGLIAAEVKADTRKLDSTEAFEKSLTEDVAGNGFGPFGGGSLGLKSFADQRRAYLRSYQPAAAK